MLTDRQRKSKANEKEEHFLFRIFYTFALPDSLLPDRLLIINYTFFRMSNLKRGSYFSESSQKRLVREILSSRHKNATRSSVNFENRCWAVKFILDLFHSDQKPKSSLQLEKSPWLKNSVRKPVLTRNVSQADEAFDFNEWLAKLTEVTLPSTDICSILWTGSFSCANPLHPQLGRCFCETNFSLSKTPPCSQPTTEIVAVPLIVARGHGSTCLRLGHSTKTWILT